MSQLALGYSTIALADHRLDDAARLLDQIGFDAIGLQLHRRDLDARNVRRLTSRLKQIFVAASEKPLVIEADGPFLLDAWQADAPSLLEPLAEVRHRRERLIENLIRAVNSIQATITISSGRLPADVATDEGLDRFADSYQRLSTFAQRHGVRLAIRPAPGQMISRITHFERLVQWLSSDLIWLAADIAAMVRGGELPITSLLDRSGLKIACAFVADVSSHELNDLPPGDGDVHWPALFSGLKSVPLTGPVCVRFATLRSEAPELSRQVFSLLSPLR